MHRTRTAEPTNLSQMLNPTTILIKVFLCSIIKHPWCARSSVLTQSRFFHLLRLGMEQDHWAGSVREVRPEGTRLHPLETQGERTFGLTEFDGVVGLVESGGTC